MQNELRARFSRWIAYFVIVPGILIVLVANALLWRVLQQAEARRIETLALAAWGRVEQLVRAESVRVKTVASMPVAAAMLGVAQRRDAELPDDPEQIEARWRNANRSDMMVRAVLDNDVSDGFVRIRRQNPQFTDIILSDFAGFAVAATSLPETYSQRTEPWWKFARSQSAGAVSTTGIRADGRADMVAGVMRAGYTNLADGLIRVTVNLERLLSIPELTNEPTAIVYVTGDTPWRIAGEETEFTSAVQTLAPEITAARLRGWFAGYRYIAQPLAGDLAWSYPAYLVVAIPGAAIPLRTFLYLGGGLGLGAFAVFGMYAIARRRGLKEFLAPLQEAAEPGIRS